MAVPYVALAAVCGVALVFAIQYARREAPVEAKMATAAPAPSMPASGPQTNGPAALAAAEAQANALVRGLTGSPLPPESSDGVPEFDVARIDPSGEAVIAGRTAPGATVELLRNGEVHDRAVADKSGQFVMISPKLPAGTYDLTLRSRGPDGKQTTSKQSVAVAIEPKATDAPVVALITPNKPTVVLSQPDPSTQTAGSVIVEAVEIEPGGKFHVSGRARAGATVRLYLNDSFVAPVTANNDGRFAVTINEGVAPGSYRVRVDELESNSSSVRARAEVPFNVPEQAVTGTVTAQATAPKRTDVAAVGQPKLAAAAGTVVPDVGSPSAVVVPKIATTTVSRGDSLWRLSQLTYGVGTRYATIYKANKQQIRNPNLIYPGQVLVVPASEARH
jgi:nucleoid-associated protein YgaU